MMRDSRRRIVPLALGLAILGTLALAPVNARTVTAVTWTLGGYVVSVEKTWTTVDNGIATLHQRGISIFATLSGDFAGTTTVTMSMDTSQATGSGTHRGELTVATDTGTLGGRFSGTTTGFVTVQGSWNGNKGTGSFQGMQIKADYAGGFETFFTWEFSGLQS